MYRMKTKSLFVPGITLTRRKHDCYRIRYFLIFLACLITNVQSPQ